MPDRELADLLNDFFKRSHAALLYALGHGGNLPPGFMAAPESPEDGSDDGPYIVDESATVTGGANQDGGCANDGSNCLCECHDPQETR